MTAEIAKRIIPEIGLSTESTVSSLQYARIIQDAILCSREGLKPLFGEFSLVYEPKNILGGDFYFYAKKGKKKYLAVCDCTGHGISGALLTILGHNMLERSLKKHNEIEKIVTYLNKSIIESFNTGEVKGIGMDMAMVCLDESTSKLEFCGAKRPLWIISEGKLNKIKPGRQSIGETEDFVCKPTVIDIKKGDKIFLFSDGYPDQFGYNTNKKFGYETLAQILLDNKECSHKEIQNSLIKALDKHRGSEVSTDDILLLSITL